ncbi:unnamed protein product [Caenorhabditis brenneri]
MATWSFVLSLIYGIVFMTLYTWVAFTLWIRRNQLKSSFYRLFLVGFVMNLLTYINSFMSLRIPQNTGYNDSFSRYFLYHNPYNKEDDWPVNIYHTLHYQFAYAQYIFNCVICLNRFTLIIFPMTSEKLWKKWFWAVVAVIFLSPSVVTVFILKNRSFYRYSFNHDYFWIDSTFGRGNIYRGLTPFLVAITVLDIIFNVSSYRKMKEMRRLGLRVPERSLLVMSFVVFFIDIFLTILAVLNAVLTISTPENPIFYELAYYVTSCTPYASDCLTLSQPVLLLCFSKTVRRKCIELIPCLRPLAQTHPWFACSKNVAFIRRFEPSSVW